MTELLTAAQMKAIEQAAIDSGQVTGLELMERAGRGVVEAVFEEWPELATTSHRAVVLCGPGNNGGDGFVVARLLKEWGWEVEAFLYGDAERLPPDARVNYERWQEMGEVQNALISETEIAMCTQVEKQTWVERILHFFKPVQESQPLKEPVDLLVDAVFGTGLVRPINEPDLWEWFWQIDDIMDTYDYDIILPYVLASGVGIQSPFVSPPYSVAIDIPSGLNADTGEIMGGWFPEHGRRAPRVMMTVTFHSAKLGHKLDEGPEFCGKLVIKDIGLSKWSETVLPEA
ncbi:MAG: NAD(P)H-hydrate epimerase [Marinosulfonomonas sp.]|nr:NAD(P)H-hydrate epimerase [Marinosulfonomonas sp.]